MSSVNISHLNESFSENVTHNVYIADNRGPLHRTNEWDRPEAHHLSRWCAEGSGAGCTRNQDPEVLMRGAADEDADVTDEDLGDPDHGEAHGRAGADN